TAAKHSRCVPNSQKSSPSGAARPFSESTATSPFALAAEPALLQLGHDGPPSVPKLVKRPRDHKNAVCANPPLWLAVAELPVMKPVLLIENAKLYFPPRVPRSVT